MYKIETAVIIPDLNKFALHVGNTFVKEFDNLEIDKASDKILKRKFIEYCDEIYDLLLDANGAEKILVKKNGTYKQVNRKTFLSKILKNISVYEIKTKLKFEGKI